MAEASAERPNCTYCAYYYVTWDARFPRGCKAYGFKSREWPTAAVLRASGQPCLQYTPKRK
ncbi:uracil-DNA glycosylase [Xylanibacillus composti]|uniref:Uracil-DNA glycosylase n=1 Tax=Xylanibacillus composti TaxID=1572762 RepID=A0A8J4H1W4_9BACL|nr:uracil-DNA glycosylase [Xylanibacillus composti]MDT9724326.1 uracil-DNA glycosylase [Xylanibacillus composti]GIQ67916.1 hypothetical protein XYCOK13_07400 [Xylanibacillus composti]